MPGDDWQRFANLRLLFGYMYAQSGKKLLFMGAEIGQWYEWCHDTSIDWGVLEHAPHQGVQRWVRDLNTCYRGERALHELDFDSAGFAWIDCNDADQSVLTFLRRGRSRNEVLVVACNFTPVPRLKYRIGVQWLGHWQEILNSDATIYGGSGQGNLGGLMAEPVPYHGYDQSISVTVPPLAMVMFRGRAPSS